MYMAKLSLLNTKSETGFQKFHFGNTSPRDEPRPGCSSDRNQNALRKLVECNVHKSTQKLALCLSTSQSAATQKQESEQAGNLASSYS